MSKDHIITGIDVGNTAVKTVIAEFNPDMSRPAIIGVGLAASTGLRHGMVVDVDETRENIKSSVAQASSAAGVEVNRAYVSLSGLHVRTQLSRGVIAVSRADNQITDLDIDRVIEAASAISLPANREIIHVIPKSFLIDGQEFIKNPAGMTGVRLEADVMIIDALSPLVRNLARAFEDLGIEVAEFVYAPLAASKAVLDKRDKEHGALVLDFGGKLCAMSVFEEGDIIHTAVLPIGSNHITNDLVIALRTSLDAAEQIKLEHSFLTSETIHKKDAVDVSDIIGEETEPVSRQLLAEVVSARVEEMIHMVTKELRRINRYSLLPAGVTIIGGGSKLKGFLNYVKEELRLPARMGVPVAIDGVVHRVDDPSFATAVGLVLWGFDREGAMVRKKGHSRDHLVPNQAVHKIKEWFKSFLP